MKIEFGPRGMLRVTDARIIFKNFAGERQKFNAAGDRNFCLVIEDSAMADMLKDEGWNVKIRAPRDPQDDPLMYIKVKVRFNDYGPNVYLQSGPKAMVRLNDRTVGRLDKLRLACCDMDIRPWDGETADGTPFRSAFLKNLKAYQEIDDPYAEEYERINGGSHSDEDDDNLPF